MQHNKKQREDMVSENYYEPVLAPEFHNELQISPNGLIHNNSMQMPIAL